ncbi:hypothetical protein FRC98_04385 [Lujinxingia vulgaris]|uniref:Uncharacterized protein n=1 Tax=Lujinxingia vulgaris TaxID=2600176 RepID=A0A5C6X8D3_9DELT|nr:hypothetical protein [Lujinxingia vulgaris]TXD38142.1 hypothetical protein FRC98_04385 [Lujinxingia vulgaris]
MGSKGAYRVAVWAVVTVVFAGGQAQASPPPFLLGVEAAGQGAAARRAQSWVLRRVDGELREYCGREVLRDGRGRVVTLSERSDWPWGAVWALWWSGDVVTHLRGQSVGVDGAMSRVDVVEGELAYCYGGGGAELCVDAELREVVYARVVRAGERWEFWMDVGGKQGRVSRDGAVRAQLEAGPCPGEDVGER